MLKKVSFYILVFTFGLIPFSCEELERIGITEEEIVNALKEALSVGAGSAGSQLSSLNGYFGNQALKILLPEEAKPILENVSRIPGCQSLIDDAILKMNRGAEKAASKSVPIFVNAIKGMTVTQGRDILMGSDDAATQYLKSTTMTQLTNAFAPEINSAMDEVGATKAWELLFSNYNIIAPLLGLANVNPNLGEHATEKALKGLFLKVAEEEELIRNDVSKRTTDLLKKVFKEQDSN
jgi:hypothetical protein